MYLGIASALLGSLLFASSNVLIRRGQQTRPGDTGAFMTMFINMVILVPAAFILHLRGELPALSTRGLLVFVVAGLLTTFLGRYTNLAAIRRIGPSRAVTIKFSFPVVSALSALILLGEVLRLPMLGGMALVLLGAYLVATEVSRRRAQGTALPAAGSGDAAGTAGGAAGAAGGAARNAGGEAGSIDVGVVWAALSAVSFGLGYTVRKVGLQLIPSSVLGAAVGSTMASAAVFTVETAQGNFASLMVNNFRRISPYYLMAGLAMTLAQFVQFVALGAIPVAIAAVLFAVEPIFTIILSRLILRADEHITPMVIISMLITVVGVGIILLV